ELVHATNDAIRVSQTGNEILATKFGQQGSNGDGACKSMKTRVNHDVTSKERAAALPPRGSMNSSRTSRLQKGRKCDLEDLGTVGSRFVQHVGELATQRTKRRVPDQRSADRSTPWRILACGIDRHGTDIRHTVDPGCVSPDSTAEAVAFRQSRDRELDLSRDAGIHGGAEIFAAR